MSDLAGGAPNDGRQPPGALPGAPQEEAAAAAASSGPATAKPSAGPTAPGPGTATPSDGVAPGDPDRWPRSAKEWDQFKAIRNENYRKRDERIAALEKDLAERESRLAGYANSVDPREHSTVREERDRLSEALRLAAVEKHPRFQAYYDGKLASQTELAKRIVGPEQAAAAEAVLKLPDSDYRNARIEELMGGLSPVAANRLGGILNAVDELQAERATEVARAREDYERATARQQSEATAAQTAARQSAERLFDDTLRSALAEDALPMLKPRPDDAQWNSTVTQRVEAAKNILFGQAEPATLVRHALAAVSFPALAQAHASTLAELDSLRAQIAQLSAATPSVRRDTAPPPPSNGDPSQRAVPQRGSRPMQAAADWIGLLNQPQEAAQ